MEREKGLVLLAKKIDGGWKESMSNFVVDTYAWIEYLDGSERGKHVAIIVEDSAHKIYVSAATVAEVTSKFLRTGKNPSVAVHCLDTLSTSISLNREIALSAGEIHFETTRNVKDFGMLDAFVVATAKHVQAKILTGDSDFKSFKNVVLI